ncbi:hypothetical protein N781_05180 [Pontibacillus halophilus JSM 076056 = DSM 19796]|uniref:Uncharacterized protein n=1 Tax=Pontibacillus halophilus JSM 076056 = DSM 19796 TaxID=1385510 RepID=A0A0A5GGP8_9BACI|nr:hypothetical protein [Pontibacillus halophilus]KGX91169.1 hypothetical protein N781_05180 [Pontibacillus halophilus JSM 076056 = DSM 19796]
MRSKVPCIELFYVMITGWWAVILYANQDLFRSVPEIYLFYTIADQGAWGSLFAFVACCLVLGMTSGKAFMRRLALFMCAVLYGIVSAGFMMADVPNTGSGVYFAIAVLALWRIREVKADE